MQICYNCKGFMQSCFRISRQLQYLSEVYKKELDMMMFQVNEVNFAVRFNKFQKPSECS